ncbi:MAG: efflux RND transporter periplasmic adaptor subunit, partial [Desulfobacteraceae bacterium]|nr:efflux RND transporter periplasmic adaptor subunit [Desulfobacteraceae bacterium]
MEIMRHQFRIIVIAFGVSLYCLTLLGCGERAETSVEKETKATKVKFVKVSPVKVSSPEGTIEYVGVLTAQRKVMIASETGGTIERLYFEKGDRV